MMTEINRRPTLDTNLAPESFSDFYWLKEELTAFCKENNIPGTGGKQEIADRIFEYLKTGKILSPTKKTSSTKSGVKTNDQALTLGSKIPIGYKNDEHHRAFFKSAIGDHFKFNVAFMDWMKENSGKTYSEAIAQWNKILQEKKDGKRTVISSQFEYNQYTRDFFDANPEKTRSDAIKCWNYKKSLQGSNKYEESDLKELRI